MSASSPYATFRADEWMRQSVINPRRACAHASVSRCPRSTDRLRPVAAVQGELFLFPVVVSC